MNKIINFHQPDRIARLWGGLVKELRDWYLPGVRGAGGNRTRAIEVLQTPAFPLRHCTKWAYLNMNNLLLLANQAIICGFYGKRRGS